MGRGRKERLIAKFSDLSVPITWKDFAYVLITIFHGQIDASTGSAARAITIDGETFSVHEPHNKEATVHVSDRKRAISRLRILGKLDERE